MNMELIDYGNELNGELLLPDSITKIIEKCIDGLNETIRQINNSIREEFEITNKVNARIHTEVRIDTEAKIKTITNNENIIVADVRDEVERTIRERWNRVIANELGNMGPNRENASASNGVKSLANDVVDALIYTINGTKTRLAKSVVAIGSAMPVESAIDRLILKIRKELNQNIIEEFFENELEKYREKIERKVLHFEQSENSGTNLEELNSYLTRLRIELERLKNSLEITQNIDGLTDKLKEEMPQTVELIKKVEGKITEIESIMNGKNASIRSEKSTPRDEFRESLDVTDTFTPKRQSEFAESSKQTNSGEKQSSLTTDLIQ